MYSTEWALLHHCHVRATYGCTITTVTEFRDHSAVKSSQVKSSQVMSCPVMSCHVMSCHVMSCQAESSQVEP